jgi:glutamate-1-semialdehyde 2,1-aminomutase
MGKYIAGGMTFGAFGGRADIMQRFDPSRRGAWPHAGTFNNNVMSMVVGVTAMTELFTSETARDLNVRGEQLRARLNAASRDRGCAMQFTGLGATMNVHMTAARLERPADAANGNMALRDLFFFELIAKGIYLAKRGMINLSLVVEQPDVERLVTAVEEFVADHHGLLAAQSANA